MKTTNFRFLTVTFCILFSFIFFINSSNSYAQTKFKNIKSLSLVADSFVKALAVGNYDLAKKTVKTPKRAKEIEDIDFGEYWRDLTNQLGKYQRHDVSFLNLKNTNIVSVTCQFERGKHEIQFVYYSPLDLFYFVPANIENTTDAKFLYAAAHKARKAILKLVTANNSSEIENYFTDSHLARASFTEYQNLRQKLGKPVAFPSVYAESESSFRYPDICGTSQDIETICVSFRFENADLVFEMKMSKDYRITSLKFNGHSKTQFTAWQPPEYSKSDEIIEETILFGQKDWKLKGILTRPKTLPINSSGYPVVVIIQGGPGPADADGTSEKTKIFKDLAWGLATRGIATFRYDKRAFSHFEEFYRQTSFVFADDTLDDAIQAVETVRKLPTVDPVNVFVLGHSLGGIAASDIVSSDPKIRGGILMAASSINFVDNAFDQAIYLLTVWRLYNMSNRIPFLTGYDKANLQDTEQVIVGIKNNTLLRNRSEDDTYGGHPLSFWMDIKKYNSISLLMKSNSPLLIQSAGLDERIPFSENQSNWKLLAEKQRNVTLKEYAELDHSMTTPGYNNYNEHLSEKVVLDISGWIKSLLNPTAKSAK